MLLSCLEKEEADILIKSKISKSWFFKGWPPSFLQISPFSISAAGKVILSYSRIPLFSPILKENTPALKA